MSFGAIGGRGARGLDGAVQLVQETPTTVANLLAIYPASATYLGKYARVTDLYGNSDEIVRCSVSGGVYYWRPQRTDYAVSSAATGGAVSVAPLFNAPMIQFTGTLLSNMTVTPSSTNAWPGCTFELTSAGILGIFGITIAGLIGSNVSLLTGATRRLIYTSGGWYSQ